MICNGRWYRTTWTLPHIATGLLEKLQVLAYDLPMDEEQVETEQFRTVLVQPFLLEAVYLWLPNSVP